MQTSGRTFDVFAYNSEETGPFRIKEVQGSQFSFPLLSKQKPVILSSNHSLLISYISNLKLEMQQNQVAIDLVGVILKVILSLYLLHRFFISWF